MFEIKDIAGTELDELLEHVGLGKLNLVESRTNGLDISEELLLGVILAPADDTLSTYVGDGTPVMGNVGTYVQGWTCARGPLLLFPTRDVMMGEGVPI